MLFLYSFYYSNLQVVLDALCRALHGAKLTRQ